MTIFRDYEVERAIIGGQMPLENTIGYMFNGDPHFGCKKEKEKVNITPEALLDMVCILGLTFLLLIGGI